jgi:hypothetical protein
MEDNQQKIEIKTDREILEEIQDNSRKTKNYMKWQLIITVALVVIPLLGTIILIPFAMRTLTSVYSSYGLGGLTGGEGDPAASPVQGLINQYTK